MKKISLKRILIGTAVGSGTLFFLGWYVTNPSFPYLMRSPESDCAEETARQPYVSQNYYVEYFRECLIKKSARERDAIIAPPDAIPEETA